MKKLLYTTMLATAFALVIPANQSFADDASKRYQARSQKIQKRNMDKRIIEDREKLKDKLLNSQSGQQDDKRRDRNSASQNRVTDSSAQQDQNKDIQRHQRDVTNQVDQKTDVMEGSAIDIREDVLNNVNDYTEEMKRRTQQYKPR